MDKSHSAIISVCICHAETQNPSFQENVRKSSSTAFSKIYCVENLSCRLLMSTLPEIKTNKNFIMSKCWVDLPKSFFTAGHHGVLICQYTCPSPRGEGSVEYFVLPNLIWLLSPFSVNHCVKLVFRGTHFGKCSSSCLLLSTAGPWRLHKDSFP